MKKSSVYLTLLAVCSLGLTGCGYDDRYGGNYYGYPGGWARQGWNSGYTVGPHYSGRGGSGPGYRRNYTRYDKPRYDKPRYDNHRDNRRGDNYRR